MNYFDHRGSVVEGIRRFWSHANVRRAQAPLHLVSRNESRKPHKLVEPQLPREFTQLLRRIAGTDQHTVNVAFTEIVNQVMKGAQKIINAILESHHTDVTNYGFPSFHQLWLRLH